MGIRLYDEVLVKLIQSWTKDPNLFILRPDETSRLYQIEADKSKDKPLKLPLIALSRQPTIRILNPHKRPLTFDGKMIESTYDKTLELNAIPISISYQIDIYTRYLDEADEYIRNFVFKIVNNPRITIQIPYNNSNILHDSTISLEDEIRDNSDINELLFPDQFVRMSLNITIDDAYLFSSPIINNVHAYEDIVVKTSDSAQ